MDQFLVIAYLLFANLVIAVMYVKFLFGFEKQLRFLDALKL